MDTADIFAVPTRSPRNERIKTRSSPLALQISTGSCVSVIKHHGYAVVHTAKVPGRPCEPSNRRNNAWCSIRKSREQGFAK